MTWKHWNCRMLTLITWLQAAVSTFHTRIVLSGEAVTAMSCQYMWMFSVHYHYCRGSGQPTSLGWYTALVTFLEWPLRVATILPASLSNTMAVLSEPPVIREREREKVGWGRDRKYGQLEVCLRISLPVRALDESPERSKAKIPGTLALCKPWNTIIQRTNHRYWTEFSKFHHYTYWMTGNLLIAGNIVGCSQTLWHLLPTLQKKQEELTSERLPTIQELSYLLSFSRKQRSRLLKLHEEKEK